MIPLHKSLGAPSGPRNVVAQINDYVNIYTYQQE